MMACVFHSCCVFCCAGCCVVVVVQSCVVVSPFGCSFCLADFFLTFLPDRRSKMNDYKAPRDKMICLLNACKVIVRLLTEAATDAGEFDLVHRSTLKYYFLPLHSWYPLKC